MVVDAFVETSIDGGLTWERCAEGETQATATCGPWAIPHAVELARAAWATALRVADRFKDVPRVRIRVIDTAGTVVEQWPKRPRVTLLAEHPGVLITGVMADP